MPDDLKTIDVDINDLKHHGTLGMEWGKWNAETAARYAGVSRKFLKNVANKTVSVGKKTTNHIGNNISKSVEKYKTERAQKTEKRKEQRAFDKETRKKYHLSASKYKKLREATLNSNDPSVVKRGMHLLNDEELKSKVSRLEEEKKIRDIEFVKLTNESSIRNKRLEAKQKTLRYQLAKQAGDMALKNLEKQIIQPGSQMLFDRLKESAERSKQQYEKEQRKQEEKEARKEAKYQQRRKQAAKETEKLVDYMKQREAENWTGDPIDVDPIDSSREGKKRKRQS